MRTDMILSKSSIFLPDPFAPVINCIGVGWNRIEKFLWHIKLSICSSFIWPSTYDPVPKPCSAVETREVDGTDRLMSVKRTISSSASSIDSSSPHRDWQSEWEDERSDWRNNQLCLSARRQAEYMIRKWRWMRSKTHTEDTGKRGVRVSPQKSKKRKLRSVSSSSRATPFNPRSFTAHHHFHFSSDPSQSYPHSKILWRFEQVEALDCFDEL